MRRAARLPFRLVSLVSLLLVPGCTASAPVHGDSGGQPPTPTPYPKVANCTLAAGRSLPSTKYADNALGAPDGLVVDLGYCTALDLFFNDGTVMGSSSQPALRVYLGRLTGSTRVDGSLDGKTFVAIGYIVENSSSLPFGVNAECKARVSGLSADLTLTRCNPLAELRFLRLSPDDQTSISRASIDAVEALSYRPAQ